MTSLRLSATETYQCWAGLEGGLNPPSGQGLTFFIIVSRLQDEGFPPVPRGGRISFREGNRVLLETNFAVNHEGRLQRLNLPAPSPGWHVYQMEYTDPTGAIGQCRASIAPFYVGRANPPVLYQTPEDGIVYFAEPMNLLLVAEAQLTGSNENGRVHVYNADTNELLWATVKEWDWASVAPPQTVSIQRQPTAINLRVELLNQRTLTVVYRDPRVYRFRWPMESRFRVTTVTGQSVFSENDRFELQAGPLQTVYSGIVRGRMSWFDGDRKIAEETAGPMRRFASLFFLEQQRLEPGLHSFRVEFNEIGPPVGEDYVPSGRSAPFEVLVTAPTRLSLTGEGLEQATAQSRIALRAAVTTTSGRTGRGTVVFTLNGAEAGRAPLENGVARLELRSLAAGSYRAEARLLGAPGYLESRGDLAFEVRAGLTVRNAASGTTAIAPGALASIYGSGLSGTVATAGTAVPPSSLAGVSIQLLDAQGQLASAGLLYVSPAQINFVVPERLAAGTATMTISRVGQGPIQTRVEIAPSAPGLFTMDGASVPAAVMAVRERDGTLRNENLFECGAAGCLQRVVRLGPNAEAAVLVVYGTGWRRVGNAVGVFSSASGILPVLFAGAQGEFAGLDQVNVSWPLGHRGRSVVTLRTASGTSNAVEVVVE